MDAGPSLSSSGGFFRVGATMHLPSGDERTGFVLLPIDETRARTGGLGRGLGDSLWRDESGLRFQGVHFTRKK